MYLPAQFAETRPEVLHALIATHALGTIVTLTADGLTANHIPFELDPRTSETAPHGTLQAHVARANRLWQDFSRDVDALVIFQGPQTYITPNWYVDTKPRNGQVVPTWNYCVVHARGPLIVHDDPVWLRGQLDRLVRRHESTQPKPWSVADAPRDFIEKQIAAIVGIEIPIRHIEGKWKVSQNRSEPDRAGVIAGLRAANSAEADAMARLVEERRSRSS